MAVQTKGKTQIIGESGPVKKMLSLIEKVAATKTNILIIGESGTGKELVAKMIHESGPMADKPFVPVNCGAIPETLIESEMFGHRKGSFTGAVSDKPGLFEAAHTGTLFLDEVGELPLSMQVKLLRAIQERNIRRIGGTDDIHVDVRIIAATNRDLEAGVAKGTFREDLYYRLNVILIRTPPLRERRSDIPLLVDYFLKRSKGKFSKGIEMVDPDAMRAIEGFDWPGNIRELENVLERAVALEPADKISLIALPAGIQAQAVKNAGALAPRNVSIHSGSTGTSLNVPAPDFSRGPINLDDVLGEVERAYLLKALDHTGGVKKKAADLLGMTFRSIRYRLKKLGIDAGPDSEE